MTKADFVDAICEKIGYSKKETNQMVDQIFDLMKSALTNGEPVKISGFGSLNVHSKKQRRGRNPQTGTPMELEARNVLKFKLSPVLKKALNR
jgi:integration host factor subunit alpha